MENNAAKGVHGELVSLMSEGADALKGKGLAQWKGGAIGAVKLAKQATAIDIRQAVGSPPNRFGVAPTIPAVPAQTPSERADVAASKLRQREYIRRTTTGKGANTRGASGVPYNIDPFRRPRTERTGGMLMSSGVPMEDTLPGRNMKSALDLEYLTPVQESCDIVFNVGGNDAPIEDWTNPGLRHTRGGLKLFKNEGHRL